MIRIANARLELGYTDSDIKNTVAQQLRINTKEVEKCSLYRLSIDARHKNDIHYTASIDTYLNTNESAAISKAKNKNALITQQYEYEAVKSCTLANRPVVVGAGPAGLFAALLLAQSGARPILIERGEDVDSRTRTVDAFWSGGKFSEQSNVQFGEGGAGAFSDGKLNTGTKDTRARKVLLEFAAHGAPDEILYSAKPHIGTDYLKPTVKSIRNEIISLGGEVMFLTKLVKILHKDGKITGCVAQQISDGKVSEIKIETDNIVLAIGHSARDTFEMIYNDKIMIEPKAFSVGARIEHLREAINTAQYGKANEKLRLGAADYKMNVHLSNGRGVYTFCMCPGGEVVAAQSEENTVVTNGMSEFARDKTNSNSAVLVSVMPDDCKYDGALCGMYFQREIEKKAFISGGNDYRAPVQRVGDFLKSKNTDSLGSIKPSYHPGYSFAKLEEYLPNFVTQSIKEALPMFGRKLYGFAQYDSVLTGVETRSSSPIRILRNENMQSVSLSGLYPCGEGAGYAGGIISAAVDGIKCAEKILSGV